MSNVSKTSRGLQKPRGFVPENLNNPEDLQIPQKFKDLEKYQFAKIVAGYPPIKQSSINREKTETEFSAFTTCYSYIEMNRFHKLPQTFEKSRKLTKTTRFDTWKPQQQPGGSAACREGFKQINLRTSN